MVRMALIAVSVTHRPTGAKQSNRQHLCCLLEIDRMEVSNNALNQNTQ